MEATHGSNPWKIPVETTRGNNHGNNPWKQPMETTYGSNPWKKNMETTHGNNPGYNPWKQPMETTQDTAHGSHPWKQPRVQPMEISNVHQRYESLIKSSACIYRACGIRSSACIGLTGYDLRPAEIGLHRIRSLACIGLTGYDPRPPYRLHRTDEKTSSWLRVC